MPSKKNCPANSRRTCCDAQLITEGEVTLVNNVTSGTQYMEDESSRTVLVHVVLKAVIFLFLLMADKKCASHIHRKIQA